MKKNKWIQFILLISLSSNVSAIEQQSMVNLKKTSNVKEYYKMLEYIKKYNPKEKDIVETISFRGEGLVDCVDFYNQPSMRGINKKTFKFPMPPTKVIKKLLGDKFQERNKSVQLEKSLFNVTCPDNTVGIKRLTIEELSKYGTLDKYKSTLHKRIENYSMPQSNKKVLNQKLSTNNIHRYAIVGSYFNNYGAASTINIWKQENLNDTEFTTSQLWILRGVNGLNRQTLEVGTVKYDSGGDSTNVMSKLFLYYYADNTNTGYYTGTGNNNGFTMVDPSGISILGALPNYSIMGGNQYEITVALYREQSQGHWWVWVQDRWIGFYNTNIFHMNGLKPFATEVQFGGEVLNMGTDMGSGRFPYEGFKYAAFQRKLRYVSMYSGQFTPIVNPWTKALYPACYNVSLHQTSSSWGTYIYFGGSGNHSSCPQ